MILKRYESIQEIPVASWQEIQDPDFPFADYEFLEALEVSGSVGEESGWSPRYLTLWESDRLLGACYAFEKTHSYGEYIFDWDWADAAQRAGVPYYPKLLAAAPFTPATGRKFLVHPKTDADTVIARLAEEFLIAANSLGQHSAHLLFILKDEAEHLARSGFHIRYSHQFHWHNQGYKNFDDFLDHLKQKRRKEIRRERQSLSEEQVTIHAYTGEELTSEHASEAYQLYIKTIEKKWSQDYLTEDFFHQVFKKMPDRIVYFRATSQTGAPLGASLTFQKGQKLFGRYWGSFKEVRNLHFELCYYQLIERAIAQKLILVEAGAQGPQKLSRGFIPTLTLSAHRFHHPGLDQAVATFVAEEQAALKEALESFSPHSPFKESSPALS